MIETAERRNVVKEFAVTVTTWFAVLRSFGVHLSKLGSGTKMVLSSGKLQAIIGTMLVGFVSHQSGVAHFSATVMCLFGIPVAVAMRTMVRNLSNPSDTPSGTAIPLTERPGSNIRGFNYLIKRGFDLVCGTILAVFVLPVVGLAALAIVVCDGRTVLYRQERVGAHGQRFEMLKLRTMHPRSPDLLHREYVQQWICNDLGNGSNGHSASGTDHAVFKLCDDPRVTRLGKFLRRFSLDELPQLWNVLRGDMSLIGPRPALPYELELYQEWHCRRLEGMPGITGLWQVSGRNRISFDDMVRLDVEYLEHWSLASDIRILLHTIPVLLRGEGL